MSVQLKYVPAAIGRGSNARVAIAYNLVTAQRADMDVSIMTWNWYAHTSHAPPYLPCTSESACRNRLILNVG